MDNLVSKIEAVLFIYGEPMSVKKLADLLASSEAEIQEAAGVLREKFNNDNSGLMIVVSGENFQLVTKPVFKPLIEKIIKAEIGENLSPAALEALSIIAYLGPISRPELDYIRGVNSSFIVRNLLMRGLVERFADEKRLNVYLYRPSIDLVKYLGLQEINELPEYEKYRSLLENFRKGPEERQSSSNAPAVNQ